MEEAVWFGVQNTVPVVKRQDFIKAFGLTGPRCFDLDFGTDYVWPVCFTLPLWGLNVTQWKSLVWTIEYYISRNIFIGCPSCSNNKLAPCIIVVVDLGTWYSWFQIKLYLRIFWRKMNYWCHFGEICRLHKGRWILSTSSISSQGTVPYFQSLQNEPRCLEMHWAHRGVSDAKLG